MTDYLSFALATFVLLAAPGPTNTMLATSAAASGASRSLPLIGAAVFGYLVATLAVALIFAPLAGISAQINVALRLTCAAYLLFSAWRMWREGRADTEEPIQFSRVLLATCMNPKGIILATAIVPFLMPIRFESAPYLAALAVLSALAALGWIGIGALVRAGAHLDAGFVRRAGAVVLAIFALIVAASAFIA